MCSIRSESKFSYINAGELIILLNTKTCINVGHKKIKQNKYKKM